MKKINLDSIKNFLSRDEMREISGGSGSSCLDWVNCNWNSQCYNADCSRCVSVDHQSNGVCATW